MQRLCGVCILCRSWVGRSRLGEWRDRGYDKDECGARKKRPWVPLGEEVDWMPRRTTDQRGRVRRPTARNDMSGSGSSWSE